MQSSSDKSDSATDRTERFRKDVTEESALEFLNEGLEQWYRPVIAEYGEPTLPIIFIVGAQRSGTTLAAQLLIRTGLFGYISNLVARFWKAPVAGCWVQRSLQRNQSMSGLGLNSDIGYTSDPMGPHEAGYFWQRWLEVGDTHDLSAEQLDEVNWCGLAKELAAMQEASGNLPLLFKNLVNVNFQIEAIAQHIPTAVFLHIRRRPEYVVQSTILAISKLFGKDAWLGPRPSGMQYGLDGPAEERITEQVYLTRTAIDQALNRIESRRSIHVDYESVAAHPAEYVENALSKIGMSAEVAEEVSLSSTNRQSLPNEAFSRIEKACQRYEW